eukprot:2506543-Prymnesium_polylepis.2
MANRGNLERLVGAILLVEAFAPEPPGRPVAAALLLVDAFALDQRAWPAPRSEAHAHCDANCVKAIGFQAACLEGFARVPPQQCMHPGRTQEGLRRHLLAARQVQRRALFVGRAAAQLFCATEHPAPLQQLHGSGRAVGHRLEQIVNGLRCKVHFSAVRLRLVALVPLRRPRHRLFFRQALASHWATRPVLLNV